MIRARRRVPVYQAGDEALADVEAITLRLEGGREQTFEIARELAVPDDPDAIYEAARTAHARLAFWSYQAARALRELQRGEREQRKLEAATYLAARIVIERVRPKIQYVETDRVRASVDHDAAVGKKRDAVENLRVHWKILTAVADALDHRTHLLRRLLAQDRDSKVQGQTL